jgi:FkbM family methyltransferase
MAELLRRRNPAIEVHACALGDAAGHFTLYVPHLDGRPVFSRASLHQDANPGFENRAITVQVRRLDEFEFQNVSVLKIDVEGHERSVLDGALDTIKRSKPVLVIEIEERHHPGQSWDMIRMVEGLGYAAHFADANTHALRPVAEFDFATMQNVANLKSALGAPGGMYINNFMFTPR